MKKEEEEDGKMKMHKHLKELKVEVKGVTCQFCHKSEVNPLLLGPLYKLFGVTVHYFCLLTSSSLASRGEEEDEGILGFLLPDIRKEIKRGEKLKCKFCGEKNATVQCTEVEGCKSRYNYHYPCGFKHGCQFQFDGKFKSRCVEHAEKPSVTLPKDKMDCPICWTLVDLKKEKTPIFPPCCKRAVYHQKCMMQMAFNHGLHFFRCPLCFDKDIFQDSMKMKSGVFIPDRDATWEMEPDAFANLKRQYNHCDAKLCRCPWGRGFRNNSWRIVRCGACAASGIHMYCGRLDNLTWRCPTCVHVLNGTTPSESEDSDSDDYSSISSTDDKLDDHPESDDSCDSLFIRVVTYKKKKKKKKEVPAEEEAKAQSQPDSAKGGQADSGTESSKENNLESSTSTSVSGPDLVKERGTDSDQDSSEEKKSEPSTSDSGLVVKEGQTDSDTDPSRENVEPSSTSASEQRPTSSAESASPEPRRKTRKRRQYSNTPLRLTRSSNQLTMGSYKRRRVSDRLADLKMKQDYEEGESTS